MKLSQLSILTLLSTTSLAAVSGIDVANADSTFKGFSYGGELIKNGSPVAGPVSLRVRFYKTAAGTAIFEKVIDNVQLKQGRFQIFISLNDSEISQVQTTDELYIDVSAVGLGVDIARQRISAAPFAMSVPVDGTTIKFVNGKLSATSSGGSGAQGMQGAQGPAGVAGAIGPVGPQGASGAIGAPGLNGVQGAAGVAGPQGAKGANGPNGAVGPQGLPGAAGSQGPVGAAGLNGTQGLKGDKGDKGDTGPQGVAGATGSPGLNGLAGADARVVEGRLTLVSGQPDATAPVNSATRIYYTPYNGNRIALYSGGSWVLRTFTQRTISLSGLTPDTNYDIFAYDNSGTVSFELVAWTSWIYDTAERPTQISRTEAGAEGVLVKAGAPTRRYIGTFRALTANSTQDNNTNRWLYNEYNKIPKHLFSYTQVNTQNPSSNSMDSGALKVSVVFGNHQNVMINFSQMVGFNGGNWGSVLMTDSGSGTAMGSGNACQVFTEAPVSSSTVPTIYTSHHCGNPVYYWSGFHQLGVNFFNHVASGQIMYIGAVRIYAVIDM